MLLDAKAFAFKVATAIFAQARSSPFMFLLLHLLMYFLFSFFFFCLLLKQRLKILICAFSSLSANFDTLVESFRVFVFFGLTTADLRYTKEIVYRIMQIESFKS